MSHVLLIQSAVDMKHVHIILHVYNNSCIILTWRNGNVLECSKITVLQLRPCVLDLTSESSILIFLPLFGTVVFSAEVNFLMVKCSRLNYSYIGLSPRSVLLLEFHVLCFQLKLGGNLQVAQIRSTSYDDASFYQWRGSGRQD